MTDIDLAALRATFPAEQVGKLPKIWCKKCTEARFKVCDDHRKERCRACGNNITDAHIDIDFVGHADVTARLLDVDPNWDWEPFAFDESGLPAVDTDAKDNPVGLWIKLTIGGVTRPGYGSVVSGKSDAIKELIGDAIRNAAMRFGVALDLWAKGERSDTKGKEVEAGANPVPRRTASARELAEQEISVLRSQIAAKGKKSGLTLADLNQRFTDLNGVGIPDAKQDQLEAFLNELPDPEPAT